MDITLFKSLVQNMTKNEQSPACLCSYNVCNNNNMCIAEKIEQKKTLMGKAMGWKTCRAVRGIHHNLLRELQIEDTKSYKNYLRMDEDTFKFVASKVAPFISRQSTHLRNPISVEERLMVTLRFLATGESYVNLQYSTRIPQCTLSGLIPETCEAIYCALKDEFLKVRKPSQIS